MSYIDFIETKSFASRQAGFDADLSSYPLFPYQKDIVRWACMRGKSAIFADTGLGKTMMQLTWASQVVKETGGKVIILAPLAVKEQTIAEAEKFGISLNNIDVNNYEQLHNIEPSQYEGVVLDESSILKGINSKTRKLVQQCFNDTPYRLSCTATPSPNDFMELGTQSEFLGVMSQVEMLAMFFVHDGGDTSKWRLKGHGKRKFFEWLATWAIFITKPSDLGYEDEGHALPELVFHEHIIDSGITDGLFAPIASGLLDRNRARKDTVDDRVEEAARIVNGMNDQCLVWCHLNDESEKLSAAIDGAVEVKGSDSPEHKKSALLGFAKSEVNTLVSKPRIAGFGMNFQSCNQMVFVGLSDSWEQFYQAVRRCWRYGQKRKVHIHIVSADIEGGVLLNIKRKEQQHKQLTKEMICVMKGRTLVELGKAKQEKAQYDAITTMEKPIWAA